MGVAGCQAKTRLPTTRNCVFLSSSLGVELQLGENMFVEVGSPVWLEFAEKVKSVWCREKRKRAAESLNDEQPPQIILPRSNGPRCHPLM